MSTRNEPAHLAPPAPRHVPFGEAVGVWARIAVQSFGGPAGQIALMHRILVEEKRWISEERFLHALNYCMLLPGPEAQQLTIYIGWLLHGTRGGIVAGTLFILPGFFAILALSVIYALYQQTTLVQALFFGLKAAVLVIVLDAVIRIGRRTLRHPLLIAIAALAFSAIFFFNVPFPLVVLGAGVFGYFGSRARPEVFQASGGHGPSHSGAVVGEDEAVINERTVPRVQPTWAHAVRVGAVGLAAWFGPLLLLGNLLGFSSVYWQMSKFFSQMAVVTFGGAYAVLAYVAQQAVQGYGWLRPGEMLNGLGLAETTPGPLIQVVQYVGFLGAFRDPGALSPLAAGVLASVVVTWATFAPCFLWIFLGAPYIEQLRGNKALSGALTAITAAVVGVILNLSVWFALNTLFARVGEVRAGPLRLYTPEWSTLSVASLVLTVIAAIALLRFRLGTLTTLALTTLLGAAFVLLRAS
ncbi:chromate efflux transporter [Deinococcus peraridilitoris]|uniref:Chromate transporter, chromate ion transporter family n=1 Tax=Deinococcus peraridilitoris (strain DSM 19664 / LMG 22246 / CIP 109416 / KR-200) TaxID=937777 RepID=K9ZZ46_DEIPD|nr:chromate efflux transporter [Deinococcus peraridilitoris]AFZ66866.1 chromate transporter, chromate ion transporter family [Deinococcus peraridilitoris DSM 19664]